MKNVIELKYRRSAHPVLSSSEDNRSSVGKQLETAHLEVLMMRKSHFFF